jgi:hypothetical protein
VASSRIRFRGWRHCCARQDTEWREEKGEEGNCKVKKIKNKAEEGKDEVERQNMEDEKK